MSLFYGESAIFKLARFQGHQVDAAIRENRDHLKTLGDGELPVNKAYNKAISKLETLRKEAGGATLTDDQRAKLKSAVSNVREARVAAAKGELRDTDVADLKKELQDKTDAIPKDKLVQNPGEPGIYRDPGTGEVVRRDTPETKTLSEQDKKLPKPYEKQGRYAKGASEDDVMNGRGTFKEGDKGEGIKRLQEKLIKAGFNVGKKGADGMWGPETEKAAKQAMMFLGSKRVTFGKEDYAALAKLDNIPTHGGL